MKTPVMKASALAAVAAAASSSSLAVAASSSNPATTTANGRFLNNVGWVRNFPRGGTDSEEGQPKNYDGKKKGKSSKKKSSDKQAPRSKKKKNKSQEEKGAENDMHKAKSSANTSKNASKTSKKKENTPSSAAKSDDKTDNKKKETHHRKHNKVVDDILKHEDDYYHVLGLDKNSAASLSSAQIQKAYRKRAVQTHPDKTDGDRRAFDIVAEAYDCLSDDTKKSVYDRYGKDGVEQQKNGAGMPSNYQDIFRSMFQQQQRQQAPPTNPTMRYQLQVTLEELYEGTTQSVRVTSPFARHYYSSNRNQPQQKDVQVHIPEGSISGESIVLSGEMDFDQDQTPGDIIFILTQVPHSTYTRKGHDIAMELTISLEEAICGFSRTIRHLNGHDIVITSAHKRDSHHHAKKDDDASTPIIINTGDVQVLKGMGMPKRHYQHKHDHHPDESDHLHYASDDPDKKGIVGDTTKCGDLYIQFNVDLPRSSSKRVVNPLTDEERNELSRLLRKLEGKQDASHGKKDKNSAKKDAVFGGGGESEADEAYQLQQAKATDFGRASGRVTLDQDDHSGHHEDGFHNPFGGSSFFQQSGGNGFTYFQSTSFGGDDEGQEQCRQM